MISNNKLRDDINAFIERSDIDNLYSENVIQTLLTQTLLCLQMRYLADFTSWKSFRQHETRTFYRKA